MTDLTIAVIDDDTISLDIIVAGLEDKLGATVFAFSRSKVALEFLKQQSHDSIHLVISDLVMPEYSGLELLATCRELQNDVPFILLTANATKDTVVKARQLDVTAFLAKPVAIDNLVRKVVSLTSAQQ